jgi:hypothetical protein
MDMRASAGRIAVIAVVACGLVACGPPEPETTSLSDAERCVADEGSSGVVEAREVALGLGGSAAFRAFQDGEEAEIVSGFQGGYMITPTIRVEAIGDSRGEACLQLRLENALMEGGEVGPGTLSQVLFSRSGDFFYVDSIYDLLGWDLDPLEGKTLLLSATVSDVGFQGTRAVTLRLK